MVRCVYTQNYTDRLQYTLACTHVSHNTQGPHSHGGMKLQFPCVTLTFVYYIQKQAKTEMYKVIMPVLVQSKTKIIIKNHTVNTHSHRFSPNIFWAVPLYTYLFYVLVIFFWTRILYTYLRLILKKKSFKKNFQKNFWNQNFFLGGGGDICVL